MQIQINIDVTIVLIAIFQLIRVIIIIHEENKAEYEDNCKETISLEIFFRKEQLRFYDETEAMVIDQI